MKAILGKKLGMTQLFNEQGVQPVTLISAGPCTVTQVKNIEKDGYAAIQLGYGAIPEKKVKKSQKGKAFTHLREFEPQEGEELKAEDVVSVSVFAEGDKVIVSSTSKGKGFQGGVKRWGFHGRNATHGVKHEERELGSVGHTGISRVVRGKKMPGHMGVDRVTTKGLKVIKVDEANSVIAIKGAVPGAVGTIVEIKG